MAHGWLVTYTENGVVSANKIQNEMYYSNKLGL